MTLKEYYKEILNTLLSEDMAQTPQRKAEGEKDIKNLEGTYKRRVKKADAIPDDQVRSDAVDRADDILRKLSNRTAQHETERRSTELYGHRGKIVKEDIETPLRNAENNKAIKNLEGKAKEKKRIWDKVSDPHSDLPPHSDSPEAYKASWNRRMTRAYKASDKFVAAREKLEARIALQQKEQASKFRIGLGGKRRKTK